MNDETREIQRQLEAATAPGAAGEGDLDAETSPLRQGWIGLGQLLEAAEASLDEPAGRWSRPVPRPRRGRRIATAVLLAASLLVVATIAWLVLRPDAAETITPAPETLAVEEQTPLPVEPVRPEAPSASPEEDRFEWDDSIDEQLVSAAQAVMSVEEAWNSSGGDNDYIWYGLEQVDDDLDGGDFF